MHAPAIDMTMPPIISKAEKIFVFLASSLPLVSMLIPGLSTINSLTIN